MQLSATEPQSTKYERQGQMSWAFHENKTIASVKERTVDLPAKYW